MDFVIYDPERHGDYSDVIDMGGCFIIDEATIYVLLPEEEEDLWIF